MKKDPVIFLKHILESIEKIELYIRNMPEKEFLKSSQTQDAVIRRIEILGEAVRNLPTDFMETHSGFDWKVIIRTRDKLIHGYFGVDLEIVWGVIKKDLPELKTKIAALIKELE